MASVFVETETYTAYVILDSMKEVVAAELISQQLYSFIEKAGIKHIGPSQDRLQFQSFLVLFPHEKIDTQQEGAEKLFTLLTNLHNYDKSQGYTWAEGVASDPKSKYFSFSLGGEAFFIPFLYSQSYAPARRSEVPLLVFNSHRMFNELKRRNRFQPAKNIIRENQINQFGFVPELLADYGDELEFLQYLLPSLDQVEMAWTVLSTIAGDTPFE